MVDANGGIWKFPPKAMADSLSRKVDANRDVSKFPPKAMAETRVWRSNRLFDGVHRGFSQVQLTGGGRNGRLGWFDFQVIGGLLHVQSTFDKMGVCTCGWCDLSKDASMMDISSRR